MKILLFLAAATALLAKDVQINFKPSTSQGASTIIERAPVACDDPTAATKFAVVSPTLAPGVASWTDVNPAPGLYCYRAFAVIGALRSVPSNTSGVEAPVEPISNLTTTLIATVTVNVTVTAQANSNQTPTVTATATSGGKDDQ